MKRLYSQTEFLQGIIKRPLNISQMEYNKDNLKATWLCSSVVSNLWTPWSWLQFVGGTERERWHFPSLVGKK